MYKKEERIPIAFTGDSLARFAGLTGPDTETNMYSYYTDCWGSEPIGWNNIMHPVSVPSHIMDVFKQRYDREHAPLVTLAVGFQIVPHDVRYRTGQMRYADLNAGIVMYDSAFEKEYGKEPLVCNFSQTIAKIIDGTDLHYRLPMLAMPYLEQTVFGISQRYGYVPDHSVHINNYIAKLRESTSRIIAQENAERRAYQEYVGDKLVYESWCEHRPFNPFHYDPLVSLAEKEMEKSLHKFHEICAVRNR